MLQDSGRLRLLRTALLLGALAVPGPGCGDGEKSPATLTGEGGGAPGGQRRLAASESDAGDGGRAGEDGGGALPGDGDGGGALPAPDVGTPAGGADGGLSDPGCRAGEPTAEALLPDGVQPDGRSGIIPGGRAVTPDGTLVHLGHWPVGLALSADGTLAYVSNDGDPGRAVQVVELASGTIRQELSGFSTFRGLAATAEGRLIVAAGRSGQLLTFAPDPQGLLQPGPSLELSGYLGDLALSPDGATAYVASTTSSAIHVVDLAAMTVRRTLVAGNYPYDLVVSPDGRRLFVSNLAEDSVSVFDLADEGRLLAVIPTPKAPEGMAVDEAGERLFVPCADADVVLVIDLTTLQAIAEFDLSHHPEGLLAASPTELSLSPDGDTLYAVQADLNQVDLVDVDSGALRGSLPAGWYPVAVAAPLDGEHLVVVSSKGLGSGTTLGGMTGLLQVVTLPTSEEDLAARTAAAWANNTRPTRFFPNRCDSPMPHAGTLPLQHVVLIVRENKTYDMVLGDLAGSNGDPALTLFGEEITPNLHALARGFVNMDNYYSDPEESIQGHLWTTQIECNDFVEKTRISQLPLAGYEAASLAGGGSVFEHCLRHGVSFRNYGEITSFGPELLGRLQDFVDPKFPFFNLGVRDVDKAREVIREWSLGIFPQFIYIGLPNDHTFGGRAGKPTPESMVADNDRATGMLVDWISRSPHWDSTIVFIIEDDPQSHAGDHVDAHRSISVVVSPWVKRGYVSHVQYSIPSVYRTIWMILGLPPLNKNDALASPMYDIFRSTTEGPDRTPFAALPLAVLPALNPAGTAIAAQSEALDWGDGVDGVPGLGRILWQMRKGDVAPPPYAKGIDR